MPFHYKRRRYKKKRGKSAYFIAKRALKKVNYISKGIEKKFYDIDASLLTVDWTGGFSVTLNDPAVGGTDIDRIGDRVHGLFLNVRGRFEIGDDDLATQIRIIIFMDKRNTVSSTADMLTDIGTELAPVGQYQRDMRNDWIKLWDKTYVLTDVGKSMIQFNKHIRLNKVTVFNLNTQTINQNRINIMYVSNIPTGMPNSAYPTVQVRTRYFYNDL